ESAADPGDGDADQAERDTPPQVVDTCNSLASESDEQPDTCEGDEEAWERCGLESFARNQEVGGDHGGQGEEGQQQAAETHGKVFEGACEDDVGDAHGEGPHD